MRTDPERKVDSSVVIFVLVLGVLLCQLLLLFPALSGFRFLFRTVAFSFGLFFLVVLLPRPARTRPHPVTFFTILVLMILAFEFAHPDSALWGAAFMEFFLYAAILSPLYWVPKLTVNERVLRRLILILWFFHSLSVCFGILQIQFPGRFQPALSSVIADEGEAYIDGLKFELPSGETVFRPMGLTDMPGGVANSGFYAVICSIAIFLLFQNKFVKLLSMASIGGGVMVIMLSHVRSVMAMTVGCLLFFVIVLFHTRRQMSAIKVVLILGIFVFFGGIAAWNMGGEDVQKRVLSLFTTDPGEVYYTNRGVFLEDTLQTYIPKYPFGAGIGRCGMAATYFRVNRSLWAEIQLTTFVFDGGVLLAFIYYGMILCAIWISFLIASVRVGPLSKAFGIWGAFVCAYDVGCLVVSFNNPIFMGQAGQEFWLLNAVLYAAYYNYRRELKPRQAALKLNMALYNTYLKIGREKS